MFTFLVKRFGTGANLLGIGLLLSPFSEEMKVEREKKLIVVANSRRLPNFNLAELVHGHCLPLIADHDII